MSLLFSRLVFYPGGAIYTIPILPELTRIIDRTNPQPASTQAVKKKPCHPWHHLYHLQRDCLMLRLYLCITRSWLCCFTAIHLYNSTHSNGSIEENICNLAFASPAGSSIFPIHRRNWNLIGRKIKRL